MKIWLSFSSFGILGNWLRGEWWINEHFSFTHSFFAFLSFFLFFLVFLSFAACLSLLCCLLSFLTFFFPLLYCSFFVFYFIFYFCGKKYCLKKKVLNYFHISHQQKDCLSDLQKNPEKEEIKKKIDRKVKNRKVGII